MSVFSSDHFHGHKEKNDLGNTDCPLLKVELFSTFKWLYLVIPIISQRNKQELLSKTFSQNMSIHKYSSLVETQELVVKGNTSYFLESISRQN